MRKERIEAVDFLKANNEDVTVMKLNVDLGRLSEIASFHELVVENQKDLEVLEDSYLVSYKINAQGEARWDKAGCDIYSVTDYVDDLRSNRKALEQNAQHRQRITDIEELKEKLGRGLTKDIVIVTALDTKINKRLIVDGCKRAVCLSLIIRERELQMSDLLNSQFSIVVLEVESRLAHYLCPADFLAMCASDKGVP